jgi:hypothetical protein
VGAILAAGGLALSIVANSVALLYFTVGVCTGKQNKYNTSFSLSFFCFFFSPLSMAFHRATFFYKKFILVCVQSFILTHVPAAFYDLLDVILNLFNFFKIIHTIYH